MKTITVAALADKIRSGAHPRLLDVRSPAEFARMHATGACLVPLEELNSASAVQMIAGSAAPLYVLCHSGSRAAMACERLAAIGVTAAVRVDGGTQAWEKASLPVSRGAGSGMSMERQVRIAAGGLMLLGLGLAWLVHPICLAISAFVGAGLVFSGVTDTCGMASLLARLPWNRIAAAVQPPAAAPIQN